MFSIFLFINFIKGVFQNFRARKGFVFQLNLDALLYSYIAILLYSVSQRKFLKFFSEGKMADHNCGLLPS